MKITVFAQIQAHPGQSDALFNILKQLVIDTHTEAGCFEYTLHRSLDNANHFWMYEVLAIPSGAGDTYGKSAL